MKDFRFLKCIPPLLLGLCVVVLPAMAAPSALSQLRPGEVDYANHPGQVVYQVLLAEIALRRGNPDLAAAAYADLARRSRDPKALERAADTAGFARRYDLALVAARQWVEVEPGSKQAQYTLASAMILANQLDELPQVLIGMLEADKSTLGENLLGINRMLSRIPDRQAVFQVVDKVCQPFFAIAEAHYAVAVAAAMAAEHPRALSEVRRSLELSVQTGGAFDITYDSVGYLYDFRARERPAEAAIWGPAAT